MDAKERFITAPQFDGAGLLEWTDEVEHLFQRHGEGGRAVLLLERAAGITPVLLLGWLREGEHRTWVARMSLIPAETDYPMSYALNLQYVGEEPGQQRYPRLPCEDRTTGVIGEPSEIVAVLEGRLALVDRIAEEAHLEASAQTANHMKEVWDQLLKPKPWWKLW